MKSLLFASLLLLVTSVFAQKYTPASLDGLTFKELDSLVFVEYTVGNIQPPIDITRYSQQKAAQKLGKLDSIYTEYTNRMGFFLHIAGQLEDAEAYFMEALALKEKIFGKEHFEYGITLNNIAALYVAQGNYAQAEPFFLENLSLQKKKWGENHKHYTQALGNLATFYGRTKQYQKAKEIYSSLFYILPSSDLIYYQQMNQYGLILSEAGEYKKAEEILLESLEGKKKVYGENHRTYVKSLINLAQLYVRNKKQAKAIEYYNQAEKIQLHLTGPTHPSYLVILRGLASIDTERQAYTQAIYKIKKALQINHKNQTTVDWDNIQPSEFIYPQQAVELVKLWVIILNKQYANTPTALLANQLQALSKSAIDINVHIKNSFQLDADKIRLLQQNNYFALMGIQSSLKLEDKRELQQAFNFAEQNKSILLADALRGTKARQLGYLPDSIAARQKQLQKKAKAIQKSIIQAKDSVTRSQLVTQSSSISIEIDAFKKQIAYEYPAYYNLKYARESITVQEIQQYLSPQTALLEYFVSDSSAYLFVITKDTVETLLIPIPKTVLQKHTRLLRKSLSDYKFILNNESEAFNTYTEEASWFYEHWVQPALQDKTLNRLIIVTDDVLGHIPFEVFLTSRANEQMMGNYAQLDYLVQDYAISYNYSATLWKDNQNLLLAKNNGQMLALAASYPRLDTTRLALLRTKSDYNLRQALSPIPKVQDEVAALEQKFAGDFLTNKSANESTFKKKVKRYNVVHLAMHGILDVRTPILSSLAFTENYDSTENNFLHTDEIAALTTTARLVTLSACETGYGKFEQGEGIMSLARSFSYAGVPALVVSLWQVNDQSTAVLMPLFYENIANGMTKDKALQQAKLSYIEYNDGVVAHPAFWSAFIQLGDSSPIALQTKSTLHTYWWLILVLVSLLGAVLFWWKKR